MNSLPWIEKYRPSTFDSILSHDLIKNILLNILNKNNITNMILYGPSGIGKTTIIFNYLKLLYGDNYRSYILELNGSDDRGINIVREKIQEYCNTTSIYNNQLKIVILDEADSMTTDAQYALKEIMESHNITSKFCLICNSINKIIKPLQSACLILRFNTITKNYQKIFVTNICEKENITYNDNGLNLLIKYSHNDFRKLCNNLQTINLLYNNITKKNVLKCMNYPTDTEVKNIIDYIQTKNIKFVLDYILKIKNTNDYFLSTLINILFEKIILLELENYKLIEYIINTSIIEINICSFGNEELNIYSLIGCLYLLFN